MNKDTTEIKEKSNTTNVEMVDTLVSSEQMFSSEKSLLLILKQSKKCCRFTPIEGCKHKYELEFFDEPLDKNVKRELTELKENTILAAKMRLSQQLIEIQIKGLEYPITIKFKKRLGGYNMSVCELYRALRLRKDTKKGIEESVIKENIEDKLKSKLAKALKNENKLKNIKDSLQKLFGSTELRDLLFEYRPTDKYFPLKYRKYIHIKTLEKLGINSFSIKDSIRHKLRYFSFDSDKNVWVEGEPKKKTKKKR